MIEILKQLDDLNLNRVPSNKVSRPSEECHWLRRALRPKIRPTCRFSRLIRRFSPYSGMPMGEQFYRCSTSSQSTSKQSFAKFTTDKMTTERKASSMKGISRLSRRFNDSQYNNATTDYKLSEQLLSDERRYNKRLMRLAGFVEPEDLIGLLPFSLLSPRQILLACPPKNTASVTAAASSDLCIAVSSSCSLQAREHYRHSFAVHSVANNGSALTVGEIAAYLDDYLYLPKKMSFMAENMYN